MDNQNSIPFIQDGDELRPMTEQEHALYLELCQHSVDLSKPDDE